MTITPSYQVVKVLEAAAQRALRLEFGFLGTENLLISLIDTIGPGRKLGVKSLRAQAMARGSEHWADDDGGVVPEAHPDVTALMNVACDRLLIETSPSVSRALEECLLAAAAQAGDGVLTTTHLSLALLEQGSGRAADLFVLRGVDVEVTAAAVRADAARPHAEVEEAPAVRLLRKAGALEGESGGGYVRWLVRWVARGQGLGGPVLTVVRNEAGRLAAAARRDVSSRDLVAAVLTVDHQLTVAGRRLKPEFESGGAAALREAGIELAALPVGGGKVERAMERAKLVAARRGDAVVGTQHLLVALRDDPADPLSGALSGLGTEM
ncbi:Clp amino terminal domain-containing protein, pathogenicity island component [Lentzea waywayandensis]|uniref:Clp amino terminal domain-containing protein, pathogenicity island component n=1 Tax=Lentzea waywayandensis TaxID=84724 RepID=A0A1I6FFL0_9PSEU|nr:Clp protease N-terminal domain-containing protein [Lentzea waywayandensis]SFR28567.1 Clp amino terminal domain-containing protein, pathogenicity island component [Lentzea waywayandensis]